MSVIVTQPYKAPPVVVGGGTTTWDPSVFAAEFELTDGNLSAKHTINNVWQSGQATNSVSSGKYYWEIFFAEAGTSPSYENFGAFGITQGTTVGGPPGWKVNEFAYHGGFAAIYENAVLRQAMVTYAAGDTMAVLLDLNTNFITFKKNNAQVGVPHAIPAGSYYPLMGGYPLNFKFTANFGATAFTYTPPAGYVALP